MSELTPTRTTNLDSYGNDEIPWSRAEQALGHDAGAAETAMFLSTVNADGTPHTTGIGALWHDAAVWVVSGPRTRKGRNLAERPACTVAFRLDGIDLVVVGEAQRVTDPVVLEQVAALYRDGGWPCEVEGDALTAPYSAPSAGPPPWYLFRVDVSRAHGVASAEPHGASRWVFPVAR